MKNLNEKGMVEELREMYNSNSAAKSMFDYFSSRKKDSVDTTVDSLDTKLKNVPRAKIEEILQRFEQIGLGKFRTGKKVGETYCKTRFQWSYSLVSVGEAAKGKYNTIVLLSASIVHLHNPTDEREPVRKVVFPLRSNFDVQIELPMDISREEVEKLSNFVNLLPSGEKTMSAA